MKIKICAFIPKSIGTPLSMCDLPRALSNQSSFDSQVRGIQGTWLKEPYPAQIVDCHNEFPYYEQYLTANDYILLSKHRL
ncbi:hypothetical protein SAMN06265348_101121 [Pedobacter westerhofensis]|uniref:Uncharacterized protein n=1 Tax=Pedobacter westerhofensis TaxID=425512 RepID=A0A521AEX2_9SPHI|nr:hypothetical protein SAMN06265348_101121 [Pedobacter westerhofensis]